MKIGRREILAAIGTGYASAIPLTLRAQLVPFSASGFLDELLGISAQAQALPSSDTLPLDRTLNATPTWSLSLSGAWKIARDPNNVGKSEGWYNRGPAREPVEQMHYERAPVDQKEAWAPA